mmetsp:Transcript_1538/g.2387  ORF Transcript_1538/g.2387 Transcript_1538/m.2387 type:complete len:529 (-) Transcript_1538:36-1622(-)
MQTSLYQECSQGSANETYVLECISHGLQSGVNTFFLIFAGCLVFMMQAGFAMVCAGAVQTKNVRNAMLKNLLDAVGAALGFYCFGYAFAYGGSKYGGPTTFLGHTGFFLMDVENFYLAPDVNGFVYFFFQFAFAATSATIVAGTLAERCQMGAYMMYSFLLTGFIYPVIVHSVWSPNGFLSPTNVNKLFGSGAIDFSGCGVIHMTGGITGLIATKILGPRTGRFFDERGEPLKTPAVFEQHSIALQALGTFLLWFGWYGFNSGSALFITLPSRSDTAARAVVTTTLGAASGALSALFAHLIITERESGEGIYDITMAMNGALSGLVSITAGCTVIEPWAAIIAGAVGGLLYVAMSRMLIKWRMDDAVDAIPVHLPNGIWGLIVVGLLATPTYVMEVYGSPHAGWFYSWAQGSADGRLLAANLVEILFVTGWVTCTMYPFFFVLNYLGWFRSDPLEEIIGLDVSYHGAGAMRDSSKDDEYRKFLEAKSLKRQNSNSSSSRIGRRSSNQERDLESLDIMPVDRKSKQNIY